MTFPKIPAMIAANQLTIDTDTAMTLIKKSALLAAAHLAVINAICYTVTSNHAVAALVVFGNAIGIGTVVFAYQFISKKG